jgi:hypothetical protein
MDNFYRSGVGLSAIGLDNCSEHKALLVSLIIQDLVNEKRIGQRKALILQANADRIPTPFLTPSKPEGMENQSVCTRVVLLEAIP